jgi:hypothetical protein
VAEKKFFMVTPRRKDFSSRNVFFVFSFAKNQYRPLLATHSLKTSHQRGRQTRKLFAVKQVMAGIALALWSKY